MKTTLLTFSAALLALFPLQQVDAGELEIGEFIFRYSEPMAEGDRPGAFQLKPDPGVWLQGQRGGLLANFFELGGGDLTPAKFIAFQTRSFFGEPKIKSELVIKGDFTVVFFTFTGKGNANSPLSGPVGGVKDVKKLLAFIEGGDSPVCISASKSLTAGVFDDIDDGGIAAFRSLVLSPDQLK